MAKIILHIDLNAFYASCEIAKNKELENKPVVVAGNSRRGIILTASYNARKFGVRAGMPLFMAEKLCRNLIILEPNMELYKHYSNLFFKEISRFADQYEVASIDEAYLDVTESSKKYTNAIELAQIMQKTVLERLKLTTSIGIAPTKFLAKMASDMKKPMGITILRKKDIPKMLWPLPIEDVHGIGKKTIPLLKSIGIEHIGDLNDPSKTIKLKQILGNQYDQVINSINGNSSDQVVHRDYEDSVQIGNSKTIERDTDDLNTIKDILFKMVESVHRRMQRRNVVASNFSIVFKYKDLKQINRSITIDEYTDDLSTLKDLALFLFENNWNSTEIRLIGFSANNIKSKVNTYKQLNIFNYHQEVKTKKDIAIENIKKKFGDDLIVKASEKLK